MADESPRFAYTVEGVGDFPLDMLRHDRAYPADAESVAAILKGLAWAAVKRSRTPLRVSLCADRAPMVERWRSFGWTVTVMRAAPEG